MGGVSLDGFQPPKDIAPWHNDNQSPALPSPEFEAAEREKTGGFDLEAFAALGPHRSFDTTAASAELPDYQSQEFMHRYGATLYGDAGRPSKDLIDQRGFGSCKFLSKLGEVAGVRPDDVRIHYVRGDDVNQDRFIVSFYERSRPGDPSSPAVKRAFTVKGPDVHGAQMRHGAGSGDINKSLFASVWETAWAVRNMPEGNNWNAKFANIDDGHILDESFALTGRDDETFLPVNVRRVQDAKNEVEAMLALESVEPQALVAQLQQAKAQARTVTVSISAATQKFLVDGELMTPIDGLADEHRFMFDGVVDADGQPYVAGVSGEPYVELRNPWGHNWQTREGPDNDNPVQRIPLSALYEGGNNYFLIEAPPPEPQRPERVVASGSSHDTPPETALQFLARKGREALAHMGRNLPGLVQPEPAARD